MTDLSNRALLVALNISQWAGRKLDKKVSDEVADAKQATRNAGSYSKRLLPYNHALDAVHKLTGAIRTEYYKLTLPWMEGLGIIKADAYLAFTARFGDLKTEWDNAVSKFIECYEESIEDARYQLNGLFSEADYPSVDEMRRKFRLEVAFYPVPSPEDCQRTALVGELAEGWARDLAAQLAEKERDSMSKAWQRVYDVVARAHERLSKPDNIFRDTLVENARELCALLPSLNITDDPELERMRQKLEGSLCAHEPDELREDEGLRAQVSDRLAEIMAKMAPMYGEAA
jgi:hypothetical protein